MELEKIKQGIDIKKLTFELAEIVKLEIREDDIVKKYKRICLLESAISKIKTKNRKILSRATAEYQLEILGLKDEIMFYKLKCQLFSEFFVPNKLMETEEKEEFREDEDFKKSVQYMFANMESKVLIVEGEIARAKETLKRYGK